MGGLLDRFAHSAMLRGVEGLAAEGWWLAYRSVDLSAVLWQLYGVSQIRCKVYRRRGVRVWYRKVDRRGIIGSSVGVSSG